MIKRHIDGVLNAIVAAVTNALRPPRLHCRSRTRMPDHRWSKGHRVAVGERGREKVITHGEFLKAAEADFWFLTHELGFILTEKGERAAGSWVTYEKIDRRVTISFEHGSGSWIELNELVRGDEGAISSKGSYNLERLLSSRGLSVPGGTLPTSDRLAFFADALKRHFSDFLRGESLLREERE